MDKKSQNKDKAKAKPKSSLRGKQLLAGAKAYGTLLTHHAYFIFVMLVLVGFAVCLLLILQAFDIDRQDYQQQQEIKAIKTYRLDRAKEVEDSVLQSQRAGAGPIKPNYNSGRDNPFVEN